MGKLAMAASGAAVVAVAALLAVPPLLAPRTTPAVAASGSQLPAGRTTSPAPSASPSVPSATGSGATPTPVQGTTGPSAGATVPVSGYPAGGPVPANFQPTSVTFIGANTGWAIGQAGTPGKCANADPSICTSVVLTQDGGQTWRGVRAPDTSGVSGIRFLNGQDGWAYGPQLWSTHDYGNTWAKVPIGALIVTDLETSNGQAFAVFAQCSTVASGGPSLAFYGEYCSKFLLEHAAAGSDSWSPVTLSSAGQPPATVITAAGNGPGVATLPTIVLQSGQGWFVGPRGQVYAGSLASGTWTQVSPSPCASTTSTVAASAMLGWSLASGNLIMACGGQQAAVISTSADGGASWTKQADAPAFGSAESLTASPAAPDILATADGIEVLNASTGQWQQVVTLQGGFSYVGMTTNSRGVAVPANAGLHEVYMTHDGGLTWTPSPIIP
jgi:hypothetical protein